MFGFNTKSKEGRSYYIFERDNLLNRINWIEIFWCDTIWSTYPGELVCSLLGIVALTILCHTYTNLVTLTKHRSTNYFLRQIQQENPKIKSGAAHTSGALYVVQGDPVFEIPPSPTPRCATAALLTPSSWSFRYSCSMVILSIWSPGHQIPELQNVISFVKKGTRIANKFASKLNKTNRKETYGKKIWTNIKLLHTENSHKNCANLAKNQWFFKKACSPKYFPPIQQYCYTDLSIVFMTFYNSEPGHSCQKRTRHNLTKVYTKVNNERTQRNYFHMMERTHVSRRASAISGT